MRQSPNHLLLTHLTAFEYINEDDGDVVYDNDRDRVDVLIDGGDQQNEIAREVRRQQLQYLQNMNAEDPLPFQAMQNFIEEQGFQRPMGGRRVR